MQMARFQARPFALPGASYVYINSKAGDGTETAWPQLISAFPSLWTSDHKVRGIAQSLVLYISPGQTQPKFLKLYQNGVPNYERIQRGKSFMTLAPAHGLER